MSSEREHVRKHYQMCERRCLHLLCVVCGPLLMIDKLAEWSVDELIRLPTFDNMIQQE